MAEIIYKYCGTDKIIDKQLNIRWLSIDDHDIFTNHLKLCGQIIKIDMDA